MHGFTVRMEREEPPRPDPPGAIGLAVVTVLSVPPAWFLGLSPVTTALFTVAAVATRAARNHRRLHQALRVAAVTIFLSFAQLTIVSAYPPAARLVFWGVIAAAAMWFYETLAGH